MSYISVKNVTKRFNDKLVLDNISFDIKEGDIFGLIGPNGAGKSTLINIITGLLKANNGEVEIGGYSISKEQLKAKEFIGLVPQELALMESLSGYDNLEYFGAFYGLGGKVLKERIEEALEVTGLSDRKKEKVKKYSGGMKRRLNLAAAIMHRPRILIMDEPTVGVDPHSRNCIFEYVRNINSESKTTILYTSHYMEEVESLCKNIYILDLGQEIAYGSKAEIKAMASIYGKINMKVEGFSDEFMLKLKAMPGVKDCFLKEDVITVFNDEENFNLESLILLTAREKKKIRNFNVEEATLEEVFLSLTGKKLRD
jgi:ABC-2 type transport system ATP-binding protein